MGVRRQVIRLIDTISGPARRVCLGDPAGVRMLCTHKAYGGYPFALFWEQLVGERDEGPTALLCSLDGCFTLAGSPAADYTELAAFLAALGADEVFCTVGAGSALGWAARKPGVSLRRQEPAAGREPPQGIRADWSPSPGRIYETLAACGSDALELPDPTAFHADLSHRLRHQGGRCLLLERDGRALACAVAAETEEAALISGLAVLPEAQGKGLGAATLDMLCGRLLQENKTVWVLSEGRTAGFYERQGFAPAGTAGWYRGR